jgi:hypothetical protein
VVIISRPTAPVAHWMTRSGWLLALTRRLPSDDIEDLHGIAGDNVCSHIL